MARTLSTTTSNRIGNTHGIASLEDEWNGPECDAAPRALPSASFRLVVAPLEELAEVRYW